MTAQLIDAVLGSVPGTEQLAPALTLPAIDANLGTFPSTERWVALGFAEAVVRGQEPFTAEVMLKHQFDRATLLPPDAVVLRSCTYHEHAERPEVFARTPEGHVHIGDDRVTVSATTPQAAARLLQTVVDRIPPVNDDDDPSKAEIEMWQASHNGGYSNTKVIEVPSWAEVRRNYPSATVDHLARLVTLDPPPAASGKLMVWYGLPGTGKTTAIRTLMREWSAWCTHHYIIDPERFFNSVPYMASVLSTDSDETEDDAPTHRLVIVEDCDEFITADARRRSGNALGRLLNLSDGILGQGSQVIILLTTNENITALHPALTRPGRCLAKVEFHPFTAEQARAWLPDPTLPLPSTTPTLAELFEAVSSTPRISTQDDTSATGLYL
ncbi:MAG: ATP-binding protein [Micrococcales bacterium]|nr:ATP-binding protein [Micrococcales bacterium]